MKVEQIPQGNLEIVCLLAAIVVGLLGRLYGQILPRQIGLRPPASFSFDSPLLVVVISVAVGGALSLGVLGVDLLCAVIVGAIVIPLIEVLIVFVLSATGIAIGYSLASLLLRIIRGQRM